jgi:hypothetical protein
MSITFGTTDLNISGNSSWSSTTTLKVLTGISGLPSSGNYEIVIPNDVNVIDANIGASLSGLTKVTFGTGCRIFRAGVFHNCPNLAEVVFTNPTNYGELEGQGSDNSNVMYDIDSNGNIVHGEFYYIFIKRFPSFANSNFETSDGINTYLGIDLVRERPFKGCPNLTKMTCFSVFYNLVGIFSNDGNQTVLNQIKTVVLNTNSTTSNFVNGVILRDVVSVTSLTINNPENIILIGNSSFRNCSNTDYNLGNMTSLKRLAVSCFTGSGITSVTIPASVTRMDGVCFENCLSLTSVTMLPTFSTSLFNGITYTDPASFNLSFSGCPNINIPSLKHIYAKVESNAAYFRNLGFTATQAYNAEIPYSDALAAGYTQNELVSAGYHIYTTENLSVTGNGYDSSLTVLTGISGLPSSGNYEIVIPNTIQVIDTNVGNGLVGLTKVTFGTGCRIFRAGVFHNCPNLAEVVFTNPDSYDDKENITGGTNNPLYGIGSNTIVHADGYYVFVRSFNIRDEDRANRPFKDCPNLSKITCFSNFIPFKSQNFISNTGVINQIKTVVLNTNQNTSYHIAYDLLFNASFVTSVTINNPENVVQLVSGCFRNCGAPDYNLGNMSNLKFIDDNTFSGSGIQNAVIPASVTIIAFQCFANCQSLTSVTVNATFSPLLFEDTGSGDGRNNFLNCPNINTSSLKHIYAKVQSDAAYFRSLGLSATQAFDAEIPYSDALAAGYTSSELSTAYGIQIQFTISNNVLTDITGPESTSESVTIPSGVTAILSTACQNKTFIGSLSIPSTVTRILSNSFLGCSNLTSLTLPGFRNSSSNTLIPLDANSFALATSPSLTRSNVNVNSLQQLRTQGYTVAELESAGFQNVPLTCFGENTKIMCFVDGREQELMVQDIRNGVLVKTFKSGYKPVCMIGTNKMNNPGNDERIKERLYICKKEKYPELTEDLIITGCHSILLDKITDEQRVSLLKEMGDIYVTEGKYRLTAAMDERAEPYNCAGEFNIYHFALEHDIYVANYGVYANGLLVESCSKRYLAEIANMTMLN